MSELTCPYCGNTEKFKPKRPVFWTFSINDANKAKEGLLPNHPSPYINDDSNMFGVPLKKRSEKRADRTAVCSNCKTEVIFPSVEAMREVLERSGFETSVRRFVNVVHIPD
jgi:DNA-directed RNA polymerase subunit RPC12/RpoP